MLTIPFVKALHHRIERRNFLRQAAVGSVGAATALAGVTLGASPAKALSATTANDASDAVIFNFALNFEYLGSQYYLAALGAAPLTASQTGPGAGSILLPAGSTTVPFNSAATLGFAQKLAVDEIGHVNFFRAAITAEGGTPISQPVIDLNASWTALAAAAGIIPAGATFNPFTSEANFFVGAYVLEDVCVTALCGAAAVLTDPTNVAYAASILGIEGYQVGLIRSYLSEIGGDAVTNAISTLRATLSNGVIPGTIADDVGTGGNNNPFNFTNADINAQAFRRTPQQVLGIAYGSKVSGAAAGGFFPNGVNGSITVATSAG